MPATPPRQPVAAPAERAPAADAAGVNPAITADVLGDDLRAFLATPRYAAISTISPDGSPHQAIVWFLLTDEGLIINSRRERHWPRNLARDPRISIAVQDWDVPDHWVGLAGRAEFLHDGDAGRADIASMARRYKGNPDAYRNQDRVSYLVRIERTFEYGRPTYR